MTALDTDDLAVITGPLEWNSGLLGSGTDVALLAGEVVLVKEPEDRWGTVFAYGFESRKQQYINVSSLTPLSEIQQDPEADANGEADGLGRATAPSLWGETPYVVFSDIHDYVYEGDE